MPTLSFPLVVLEEAFGNFELRLEKCDDDPRLSESDRRKLRENPNGSADKFTSFPNKLNSEIVTTISIRNCPYKDFDIVLVHDQIISEEGWMESQLPAYLANFQKFIDISNHKSIFDADNPDKEGYESTPGSRSDSDLEEDNQNQDDYNQSSSYVGDTSNLNVAKNKKRCRCDGCGKDFTRFDNAQRHKIHSCPARSKGYLGTQRRFSAEKHKQSEKLNSAILLRTTDFKKKNGKFQCNFCKEHRFKSAASVQAHQLSTCPAKPGNNTKLSNGMTKCNYCEKTFAIAKSLVEHVQITHMELRRFKCSLCSKRFTRAGALAAHMTVHTGERRFKCLQCGKKFTRASGLYEHTKAIHSGLRPFGCPTCGFRSARRATLSEHMMTHMEHREKLHKCNSCEKSFTTKKILREHSLVHSNTKPFKCPFCKMCSKRKRAVKIHISRFHKNEKFNGHIETKRFAKTTFQCKICNKPCNTNRALKDHLLCHTNTRAFKCPFCFLHVKRQRALQAHIARFHSQRKGKKAN